MEERANRNRSWGIDLLRLLCAVLIVWRHSEQHGIVLLEPYTRIAVPVFFMITGYFYTGTAASGKQWAQIKKQLLIFLGVFPIYIAWSSILQVMPAVRRGADFLTGLLAWLRYFFLQQDEQWLDMLLFNKVFAGEHLWYILALLYVLIFAALMERLGMRKKLYPLIPVLLTGNLVLGSYAVLLFGRPFSTMYIRNSLLTGLPLFLLGDWLYSIREKRRLGKTALWAILLISLFTTTAEHHFLTVREKLGYLDMYISTPVTAAAIFLLSANTDREAGALEKKLARWGRDWSLWMYLFHPIIMTALCILVPAEIASKTAYRLLFPVFVLILSVILAIILQNLKQRCKRNRKKKTMVEETGAA